MSAYIIPLLINFQNNGSDVIVRNLDSALASYKTPKCDSVGSLFQLQNGLGERCVTSQKTAAKETIPCDAWAIECSIEMNCDVK